MDCPLCGSQTRVLESRRAEDGVALRRRRRCSECGHRFTTFERREGLVVVKRSGRRQPFDRGKLLAGLVRASHKRDVDPRELEAIVDRIEREGLETGEITAERIGELCLDGLRPLDDGAFMQFAGTLPDGVSAFGRNPRKNEGPEAPSSVRTREDAQRPTPKERLRGDR